MTVRDLGDNDYDVVIVGGGPAGLSAGMRCSNEGIKTLLVERDPILTAKKSWTLGSREGRNKVKKIGLDVAEIGCNRIYKSILRTKHPDGSGVAAKFSYKRVGAFSVEQDKLTEYMLNMSPKLDVKDKTSVVDAKRIDGGVVLKLSNENTLQCKIVIDASGGTREPSRLLGRGFNQRAVWIAHGYTIKGVKTKEFGVDSDEYAWVWGQEVMGQEVWDYCLGPKSEDTLDLVVYKYPLLDKINPFYYGEPTIGMNQRKFCRWYLQNLWERVASEYKDQLKKTKKLKAIWGLYGETWETRPFDDNLLMVGDAAGHASPWMGEGVLQSIIFGKDAGDVAVESVTKGACLESFLKRYYKLLKKDDIYNRGFFSFARFYFPRINEGMMDGFHEFLQDMAQRGDEYVEAGHKVITSGKFKSYELFKYLPGFTKCQLKGYLKGVKRN